MYGRANGAWRAPADDTTARMADALIHHERLAAEQAAVIAHYKKMYDRSSALAKIGVWECKLPSEALTWTDGVYDLFELPRGSPIDRARIVELYDEPSRREMERLRAAAIHQGVSFTLDIKIRTAKGNERWLRLTGDLEREHGRPARIFGTKQDITEEKSAQERVKALQTQLIHVSRRSAMDAMAATLAHELNQPLTAISNYAAGTRRVLERRQQPDDLLAQSFEEIEKCALRAGAILRRLREMTCEGEASRPPVDLNALVREAGSLAIPSGAPASLQFALGDDIFAPVDPLQIQQVLIILLKNALEAVQEAKRPEIRVATSVTDGDVVVDVDDTGCGIPPDLLPTIFDSFASSKADGLGMGLSISRTIVEAHGGRISAANRAGGGASFRMTLPTAGWA
jgi:two-component system sensor kinase FixL